MPFVGKVAPLGQGLFMDSFTCPLKTYYVPGLEIQKRKRHGDSDFGEFTAYWEGRHGNRSVAAFHGESYTEAPSKSCESTEEGTRSSCPWGDRARLLKRGSFSAGGLQLI